MDRSVRGERLYTGLSGGEELWTGLSALNGYIQVCQG